MWRAFSGPIQLQEIAGFGWQAGAIGQPVGVNTGTAANWKGLPIYSDRTSGGSNKGQVGLA